VPLESQLAEDQDERLLLRELDETLEAQQQLNQHLQTQQEQTDRIQAGAQQTTLRLDDALRENVSIEKSRTKQTTMAGTAVGTITGGVAGAFAGPAAVVTVPLGAGLGGFAGWGIGSFFAKATSAAVDRELERYDDRHHHRQHKEKDRKDTKDTKETKETSLLWGQGDQRQQEDENENEAVKKKRGNGKLTQPIRPKVVVSFRCWENQRYSSKTSWDHGNLTTGERGRWWVEAEAEAEAGEAEGEGKSKASEGKKTGGATGGGGGGGGGGGPAVMHPEPMFEPEIAVTWLHDWLAEEVMDPSTGKVMIHTPFIPYLSTEFNTHIHTHPSLFEQTF